MAVASRKGENARKTAKMVGRERLVAAEREAEVVGDIVTGRAPLDLRFTIWEAR